MERIKHAIEKAKQQGEEVGVLSRPAAAPAAIAAEIESISYQQTRVVELRADHLARYRIVALNKNDQNSLSFDLLRTQVLKKMEEHDWRTLAILSPVPECGKTVMAINLAMSIAHHTQKTAMLIDFDLRRPKIAKYLGLPMVGKSAGKSLNDVLDGNAGIGDILVNPGIPKLVVAATAQPVKKPAEMLASAKVKELVRDLRNRYPERIVIFDLPPMLNADDALSLLPEIDCVLMVVGNGMVTKHELDESLHHVRSSNLLGVVLNKADAQKRSYYY